MGLTTFEKRGYCPECRRNVLARYKTFDHFTHFVLMVMSCMMWAPFFMVIRLVHVLRDPHLCTNCGSLTKKARRIPRRDEPDERDEGDDRRPTRRRRDRDDRDDRDDDDR